MADSKFPVMTKSDHLEMFKDWMDGLTHEQIAAKRGMKVRNVKYVADRYKWHVVRDQIKDRRFEEFQRDIKHTIPTIAAILDRDSKRLIKDVETTDRLLTTDERRHLRDLLDRLMKEVRLEEGQPTGDGSTGPSVNIGKVQIVAPPEMAAAFAMFTKNSNAEIVVDAEVKDKLPEPVDALRKKT
jgi:hypothetical protein